MTIIEQFRAACADILSIGAPALARRCAALGALTAVFCLLPGCATDYASSDPGFPGDFQARHPIALVSAPTQVEVFPVGGALDARTVANLRSFAGRYRNFGSGEIIILVPGYAGAHARTVAEIRRVLRSSGLRAKFGEGSYIPFGSGGAAPIRVAFMGLKAKVPTPCGLWPEDLASGSSLEGWKNEPYANFGCATQSVIAAQVDDPRDFVQPRALAPSDVAMRTRAIEAVRRGQDPVTSWSTTLTPIGGGVQ
jgi:pilus assembly protein CpaD